MRRPAQTHTSSRIRQVWQNEETEREREADPEGLTHWSFESLMPLPWSSEFQAVIKPHASLTSPQIPHEFSRDSQNNTEETNPPRELRQTLSLFQTHSRSDAGTDRTAWNATSSVCSDSDSTDTHHNTTLQTNTTASSQQVTTHIVLFKKTSEYFNSFFRVAILKHFWFINSMITMLKYVNINHLAIMCTVL